MFIKYPEVELGNEMVYVKNLWKALCRDKMLPLLITRKSNLSSLGATCVSSTSLFWILGCFVAGIRL